MATIKERKQILRSILMKQNLTDENKDLVRHYFLKYYKTDDDEDDKIKSITDVMTGLGAWDTYCFMIRDDEGEWHTTSMDRLAGAARKDNLVPAMRNAIQQQIEDFKCSTKKPDICPLNGGPIGSGEIDHVIEFSKLQKAWRETQLTPTYSYNKSLRLYELDEPYLSLWRTYHKTHAELRWTSKEGNRMRGI